MDSRVTVKTDAISLSTAGHTDVKDITGAVSGIVDRSGLKAGIATIFVVGSTAGITTIEFEPGLVHDIRQAFERLAPVDGNYKHHERWGDNNGHSHVRAALIGPSITVPFSAARLALGTWQQIVLVDFDTTSRQREVIVQLIGVADR